MTNESILLVQPNYNYEKAAGGWGYNPPLGLAYIAAVLERNGVNVRIIDANVENLSPKQVAKLTTTVKPTFVGISLMTTAHSYGADVIKQLPESIIKIAGGPHATALPEELLNNGFDVVVRGEGEYSTLDVLTKNEMDKILGISYKDENGQIFHNPDRAFLDPNVLSFPARHLLRSGGVNRPYSSAGNIYFPFGSIVSSRGCPYGCYYCSKDVFGKKFRFRTVDNVMSEIVDLVERYKIKELNFYDDCFNFNMERAYSIMNSIIDSKLKLHIRFSNGLRIDRINKELLEIMREAGTKFIAYGIESGNQAILDRIPKKLKLEEIEVVVKMTKDMGIQVMGFFMLGLFGDTEKSMQETIDFAKKLKLNFAQFTIATPYPGTEMWKTIKKEGQLFLNYDSFHHHDIRHERWMMPNMASYETVAKIFKKANKQYYFRFSEIVKQLKGIRSLSQIALLFKGFIRVLYAVLRK